jgi:hypothetical protein
MRSLAVSLAVLTVALPSCDANGPCTTSVEPGLVVRVLEDATGAPAAHGASGLAVDDEYREVLRNPTPDDPAAPFLYGADEREGTYVVSVTKDGYQPWIRAGVRVTAGECHVRTVTLETRLVPASPAALLGRAHDHPGD